MRLFSESLVGFQKQLERYIQENPCYLYLKSNPYEVLCAYLNLDVTALKITYKEAYSANENLCEFNSYDINSYVNSFGEKLPFYKDRDSMILHSLYGIHCIKKSIKECPNNLIRITCLFGEEFTIDTYDLGITGKLWNTLSDDEKDNVIFNNPIVLDKNPLIPISPEDRIQNINEMREHIKNNMKGF